MGARYHVLLIEDERIDAELIAEQLSLDPEQRFEVHWECSVADGVRAAAESQFDVVLLDLHLPDSSGAETILRVRSHLPSKPIVVLTGRTDPAMTQWAARHGAQDYLDKNDLSPQNLARAVLFAIERSRMLGKVADYARQARSAESQLRYVIFNLIDAVLVVSRDDGTIRFGNPAAERLLGRRDLLGRPFPHDLRPGRFIPFTVPGPKSTQRHCEMCVTDMEWNGAPAYVVSIRDRTEHERVQLLEQRLRDLQSGPWLSRRKSSPGF